MGGYLETGPCFMKICSVLIRDALPLTHRVSFPFEPSPEGKIFVLLVHFTYSDFAMIFYRRILIIAYSDKRSETL